MILDVNPLQQDRWGWGAYL